MAERRKRPADGRRILAPSDIVERRARLVAPVRVGGRVVESTGRELWVADAYASLHVSLRRAAPCRLGDHVVIEGRARAASLEDAKLVERHEPPDAAASDEFLRLLWQGTGQRLRARARAFGVIREYFAGEGFVEVDTPLRVRSPGLDLHVDAIEASGSYLITSPEYHMKRLLAGGMPRIFQLVHASRADESGRHHEPEFMMLEWYRAFAGFADVITDTERIVTKVTEALTSRTTLKLFDGRSIDLRPPFPRLSVREAFRRFAATADAVELAKADEQRYFELLVSDVEPALARYETPVFLCDYPLTQASLARPSPRDPTVAERFELYVAGIELCNGFGELTDARVQRQRLERDLAERRKLSRPEYPIDDRFLAALESGLPPSSGNALGLDRLLMLALSQDTIAKVQPFPTNRL